MSDIKKINDDIEKISKEPKKKEYNHICVKCNYKCNFSSQWIKHCETELHKTGKRKKRTDKKEVGKCKKCDYETSSYSTMLKHILNKHSTKEERKSQFKHYCETCDFGTFSGDTFKVHTDSNKHKLFIERTK